MSLKPSRRPDVTAFEAPRGKVFITSTSDEDWADEAFHAMTPAYQARVANSLDLYEDVLHGSDMDDVDLTEVWEGLRDDAYNDNKAGMPASTYQVVTVEHNDTPGAEDVFVCSSFPLAEEVAKEILATLQ